jgi:cytochrome c
MLRWVVAAGLLFVLPAVASAQDIEAGKKVFALKCKLCHAVPGPDAKNSVGPNLNGVLGRKAGTEAGYTTYSEPLKASGITWDDASLHEWITDPKKKVPGTKMLFAGDKDETERDDLVAYISSFNADGSSKK